MTESTPADAQPAKQHGDPLLDTAQGRGDGTDASRHGAEAAGSGAPAAGGGRAGEGAAGDGAQAQAAAVGERSFAAPDGDGGAVVDEDASVQQP
jgi:hypothetical protein